MGADNATAHDALGFIVEQKFGKTLGAAIGEGAARCHPGEHGFSDTQSGGFALLFGLAGPRNFGVGVSHRRNLARLEFSCDSRSYFGSHMRLMHRLVRKHGLTDDVTDGKDVSDVGPLRRVYRNEALLIDRDAGMFCADQLAVGPAAGSHQHQIKDFAFTCGVGDFNAVVARLCCCDRSAGQHAVKAMGVHFFPDLDQIAVRPGHHVGAEFGNGDA